MKPSDEKITIDIWLVYQINKRRFEKLLKCKVEDKLISDIQFFLRNSRLLNQIKIAVKMDIEYDTN